MIITQTPLRVSLFGGGTDFPSYFEEHGGCVLSTAIDKYIFVTIKQRFDDKFRVGYTKTELVDNVDEIQHGLIREALWMAGVKPGVEITMMADIPSEGSGLGSSSAVTVGALHAAYAYLGVLPSAQQLASEAIAIELGILLAPIGIQDQHIAAYGGLRLMEFGQETKFKRVEIAGDAYRKLDDNLMLFYTGTARKASTVLAEQESGIKGNTAVLDDMKHLAQIACSELQRGNVDAIGPLLHESWLLKKRLASGVSNGRIDDLYNTALRAGATGGKISGAGGGGFLLLYCPYEKQQRVRDAFRLRELPFKMEHDGTKVIFNYRR